MNNLTQAKIISWTTGGAEVCASAARISTTLGDALALFEKAQNNPNNQDLIGKVVRSGHRSVIEHAVFSIALQNVSVFVEQYFIECRLASFTVKSRRYVDFSGLGYYVPPALEGASLTAYRSWMDGLFDAYQAILDAGVPKEDARFVLPYAFCSNFYCTLNARELIELIRSIRHGRGRSVPELQAIAVQLSEQLGKLTSAAIRSAGIVPGGRKCGPHAFRASLASSMVNDDVPYEVVRNTLGHTDVNAIKSYAKLDVERLRIYALAVPEAAGYFAKILSGGRENS